MPVLALPGFTQKFIVETNASGVIVSTMLSQGGHRITFFSKKMCPRMQVASVYVREMYVVTKAVKMALISYWSIISYLYRSKEFTQLVASKNSNSRTIEMGI